MTTTTRELEKQGVAGTEPEAVATGSNIQHKEDQCFDPFGKTSFAR
jgi:hypothetical protein